jgi:hypothetical protein
MKLETFHPSLMKKGTNVWKMKLIMLTKW